MQFTLIKLNSFYIPVYNLYIKQFNFYNLQLFIYKFNIKNLSKIIKLKLTISSHDFK